MLHNIAANAPIENTKNIKPELLISMFSIVPYIKKKIAKSSMEFIPQENRLIGRTIVLQEDLNSTLLVNIDGVFWTIKTLSGDIPSGTKVKIVSMEGNKYIVEKV